MKVLIVDSGFPKFKKNQKADIYDFSLFRKLKKNYFCDKNQKYYDIVSIKTEYHGILHAVLVESVEDFKNFHFDKCFSSSEYDFVVMKLNSDIEHSFAEMIDKQSKMKFEILEKLENLQNKLYSMSVYDVNEYDKIKKYMSCFESIN